MCGGVGGYAGVVRAVSIRVYAVSVRDMCVCSLHNASTKKVNWKCGDIKCF